jgi:hypothetical protein
MPLLKYVHATGRFKSFFGKDVDNKVRTNSHRNGELWLAAKKLESSIRKAVSDKCKQTPARM